MTYERKISYQRLTWFNKLALSVAYSDWVGYSFNAERALWASKACLGYFFWADYDSSSGHGITRRIFSKGDNQIL